MKFPRWALWLGVAAVAWWLLRRRAQAGEAPPSQFPRRTPSLSFLGNVINDPASQTFRDAALRKEIEARAVPIRETAQFIESNDLVKKTGLQTSDLYKFFLGITNDMPAGDLAAKDNGSPSGSLDAPRFSFDPFPAVPSYDSAIPRPAPPAPPSPVPPPSGANRGNIPTDPGTGGSIGQKIINVIKHLF